MQQTKDKIKTLYTSQSLSKIKNPTADKPVEVKEKYDPVELRKQLTQNTYLMRKMAQ